MSANTAEPRHAVYAGSFDPPTSGHTWMIEQGARLFDQLTVAVGVNPSKASTFDLDTRTRWLTNITVGMANVSVGTFENLFLAHYAKSIGANFIIRGMRNVNDYTYELAMRHINSDVFPEITTVFLIPPRDLIEVSSSAVKGMIGPVGWEEVVKRYLPAEVFADVKALYA
ncbi:MAG: pantetheine-phosphate adenylyltransferase [Phycisphaerales bacterium]|nr:pantetheine-phosphate adenylyltransferase [Phycisphaerales bacterium]